LKAKVGDGKRIGVWIEESYRKTALPLLADSAGFSGKDVG